MSAAAVRLFVVALVLLASGTCVDVVAAEPLAPKSGSQRAVSWWYSVDNENEIQTVLDTVKQHRSVFTSIMLYCGYSVSPAGNLTFDGSGYYCGGPSGLVAGLKALGVRVEFVVNTPSGDPLQPFLNAFANPGPIVDALVDVAKQYDLYGWNLDLEPASSSAGDATKYATFLKAARPALQAVGTRLTIDVADWSPMLYAYPLLSGTGVRMMDMETYNGDSLAQWMGWYTHIVNANVPRSAVSVGLGCWVNQNTNGTWAVTKQSALERIAQISKDGVQEVSMFRLLPTSNWPEEFWWDVLQSYITGTV